MKLKQLIREYNFNIEPSEQEFSQYIDENKKQELIQELINDILDHMKAKEDIKKRYSL